MPVADYSTTPASNTTISGINVAELCPPGGMNDAIRQLMADIALMLEEDIPDISGLVTADAGSFSGTQPKYTGRGAMLHHNSSANTSGRIYVQAEGAALPSLSNGDIVFTY